MPTTPEPTIHTRLERLQALDTNTVSDALDFLALPGATVGLRPLWNCPKIAGRASIILMGPRTDPRASVHPGTQVIDDVQGDDRVLIVTGGIDGISSWGDLVANAAQMKHIRGSVLDGFSRDIEGSEAIGYPVYGRGITMISARNRVVQIAANVPVTVCGVGVRPDDYVLADRCGTVFVDASRIDEVLGLAERIARRQDAMVKAIRAGRPVAEVMHDKEFEAIFRGTGTA